MFKLSESADSPDSPPDLVNFDLSSESRVGTAGFNPLHQFDHIGKKKLDQVCRAFFIIRVYFGRKSSIFYFSSIKSL